MNSCPPLTQFSQTKFAFAAPLPLLPHIFSLSVLVYFWLGSRFNSWLPRTSRVWQLLPFALISLDHTNPQYVTELGQYKVFL